MSDGRSLWRRSADRRPGPKPTHTLEDIAAACVRIADADGIGAVSMRRVAAELNAAAPSLYRYVGGKDDLLALMADAVLSDVTYPRPTGDVRTDVHALAEVSRAIHLRHPWLVATASTTQPGPRALVFLDRLVGALAPGMREGDSPMLGAAMISGWVAMFAARQSSTESTAAVGAHIAAMLADGDLPHLAGAMSSTGPTPGDDDTFTAGIDALLFGIVRARTDQPPR
ncbi:TetR/AcrR family transcriptional regulator [Millisia brevis]|uniref:TetR/AcrR family transcriptional regulator n=1 Tax=Millisia brevis TaxID=264148 RepID=UPI0008358519|nr:TetR/AcrR family transcriptional regulator [Millisia brevis]